MTIVMAKTKLVYAVQIEGGGEKPFHVYCDKMAWNPQCDLVFLDKTGEGERTVLLLSHNVWRSAALVDKPEGIPVAVRAPRND